MKNDLTLKKILSKRYRTKCEENTQTILLYVEPGASNQFIECIKSLVIGKKSSCNTVIKFVLYNNIEFDLEYPSKLIAFKTQSAPENKRW